MLFEVRSSVLCYKSSRIITIKVIIELVLVQGMGSNPVVGFDPLAGDRLNVKPVANREVREVNQSKNEKIRRIDIAIITIRRKIANMSLFESKTEKTLVTLHNLG